MIHKFSRLLMTLVALFAMTAGAWAQATFGVKEITPDMVPADWNNDDTEVTAEDLAKWGFKEVTEAEALTWTGAPKQGTVKLIYTISFGCRSVDWKDGNQFGSSGKTHNNIYNLVCNPQYNSSNDIYITTEPPLEVTWNAATKTGTFDMPGSDVVLTPIYAPVAQWATESDVELLPTAAEGIFAGTTDPIIVEGTVAPGQGTVMYAVTTDATTAPTLTAFSATVPTAENIADDGDTVYVWYYIQGAVTPDGQEATAENTFNDSEICATPLEVSVLSNQFDITFNAANANTIEAGKATVTVGGTAATVTEGKLEGVKMGSEVKMTAKQGYKFRKVEAKKTAAPAPDPTLANTLTNAGMTVKVNYNYNGANYCVFVSNGDGTYTFQSGGGNVGGDDNHAKALVVENGKLVFKQNYYDPIDNMWDFYGFSVTFDTSNNTYSQWSGISASFISVEVNGTQIAVTEFVDETGD